MDPDFVRELYKRELDEKLVLDTRPTFHAIVLSSAVGIIAWSYSDMPSDSVWWRFPWSLCVLLSCAAFAYAAKQCFLYMAGFEYEKIAVPALLRDHYACLKAFLAENPCDTTDPREAFAEDIKNRMIEATTNNATANAQRSELHVRIVRTLVIGTLLAGIPPVIYESVMCLGSFRKYILESGDHHVEEKALIPPAVDSFSDEQRPAATAE
ncbi:MAG: hypothetical protein NT171_07785 [Planctomycetota bacterium]|nr:hypothetical protein [Planctomycetota bacterium]